VLAALVLAGVAVAGMTEHFQGKAGKATISLDAAGATGKLTKIKDLTWDNLKCGSDVFTGGTSKPIRVKMNRTFASTQPVGGVSVSLKVTVSGTFSASGKSVKGKLSIKGACTTPKTSWHASKS
jgi:hypothetical protein